MEGQEDSDPYAEWVTLDDTDVETDSVQGSTITQFQFPDRDGDGGSETDFYEGYDPLDELIDQVVRAPCPGEESPDHSSVVTAPVNVEEWRNEGESQLVAGSSRQQQTEEEEDISDNYYLPQDVEKVAAVLNESVKEGEFISEAWIKIDDTNDQEVPGDNYPTVFAENIKSRLPMALMDIINNVYGLIDSPQWYRYFSTEVLCCASKTKGSVNVLNSRDAVDQRQAHFERLATVNNREYYSDFKLPFRRVAKNRQPIVHELQKFVNNSIGVALESKQAVLFNGYSLIPEFVEGCITKYGISLSTKQVEKYSLRIQQAVYQGMVDRCLKLLASAGYELRCDSMRTSDVAENLSSNESATSPSCVFSSQDSHSDGEAEPMESQSPVPPSIIENDSNQQPDDLNHSPSSQLDPAVADALRHSPDLGEYLRGNLNQHSPQGSMGSSNSSQHSPEGSMGSSNSSYSLTPPTYSLPERDRSPILIAPVEYNGLNGSFENSYVDFAAMANLSPPHLVISDSRGWESSSQESSDEGPQRRRRRIN